MTPPDPEGGAEYALGDTSRECQALLAWALHYAARGWPVLPLRPRGKVPLTRHGVKDASTAPDVIRGWWTRWPDANIGLATGVAFDVLDLDDGATPGLDAIDAAARDDGPDVGPFVLTGRGLHWYLAPTGLGNRAGFLPSCDWRGTGGYVVAPPSIHPSGHRYAFDPEHGIETPLPAVPAWLLDLLRGPARAEPKAMPAPRREGSAYGRRALATEVGHLALVAQGTRNHELNRAAFRMGQLVAGGELDAYEVAADLLTVAGRIGHTEKEAVATIRSGMASGMAHPRRAPEASR